MADDESIKPDQSTITNILRAISEFSINRMCYIFNEQHGIKIKLSAESNIRLFAL